MAKIYYLMWRYLEKCQQNLEKGKKCLFIHLHGMFGLEDFKGGFCV